MGPGASVIDVAKDMQLVDGEALDHVADGFDKGIGTSCRNDSVNDDGHIGSLILVVSTLMQQFFDNV